MTINRSSQKQVVKNLYVFIALLIASVACDTPDPVKIYVIRKGEHYASPRATESLQSDVLEFDAVFDESAVYDFQDKALQTNKNKLLGFSDCNALHHENSARFAWVCINNSLEIHAYCYVNGERREAFIGNVTPKDRNTYKIMLSDSHYNFQLNNEKIVRVERGTHCERGLYYMLWPYFGGSEPAPHDVRITIYRQY